LSIDSLLPLLACPVDLSPLRLDGQTLRCDRGHVFPVVDGIPILLRADVQQTHWAADLALLANVAPAIPEPDVRPGDIDPFVQEAIGATGGYMYEPLVGRLTEYPIPRMPLPPGAGRLLLDVGCSWGRWSIAAARAGYAVVGIDPALDGVRAAQRVCRQLGIAAAFVVGDARHLPFRSASFDQLFSYSVIQHFSKPDARTAAAAAGRVLRSGGAALIQMPNALGVRSLYHQARRGFREPRAFEVRYWTPAELERTFTAAVGPTDVTIDGFFSLNAQPAEARLLPWRFRLVVRVSSGLKRASRRLPLLRNVADSLWVSSRKIAY
jgi:SAM-dependent methyltransferase